jgi:hypothetical protein
MVRINFSILKVTVWLLAASLTISACALITPRSQIQSDEAVFTQAAQTIQARLTQQVYEAAVAQLTQIAAMPTATATDIPPTPTETQVVPTNTLPPPVGTTSPVTQAPPTKTSPPATAIPIPCDKVEFIRDITFEDGSVIAPSARFTKIWRVKNTGSCTWNTNYALVFVSGERMKADKQVALSNRVFPGETVDLSVEFTAPSDSGRFRSFWMISNPSGKRFGIGKNGDQSFWVDIRIKQPSKAYVYDFAGNMCAASWRSSAGKLGCPGDSNNNSGSVILVDRPWLENGRREDEATLWTRPHATRGGWISGTYPAYKVKEGDHFRAAIGCMLDSNGCELTFSLDYQVVGKNKVRNLASWVERYDGAITSVDVDLASLEGKEVQFILTVTNHGKPSSADGFWLVPSIRRYAPTPPTAAPPTEPPPATPTATPTETETPTPTPTVTSTPTSDGQAIIASQAARQALAQDLGIDVEGISILQVEWREWPDSCLGVLFPPERVDIVCLTGTVPGYLVILETSDGSGYEAHTNLDGSIVLFVDRETSS